MTRPSKHLCESAFCAISKPSKPCWPGQPSSMQPENTRSHARPSHAWCSAPAHTACSRVCLMGPTPENETCILLFKQSFGGSSLVPTKLSMTAIAEHADLKRVAKRLQEDTGTAIPLPSYRQVHDYVQVLK